MSKDYEPIPHLPNLPKKLASRIIELPDHLDDGETIIGNGDLELTSEHPVSVVEYFLAVKVDEVSDSTYKDVSYDLTRFLEYCEYADTDDLSKLSLRDVEAFKQWRKRDDNVGLVSESPRIHPLVREDRDHCRWSRR
jgi:hypothetical protein